MAVTKVLNIGIKEKAKYVSIISTSTQFQGSSPANITLQAKLYGVTAKSYAWYKGVATTIVGTNQNFIIANSQVTTVETYKIVVTSIENNIYESTISITKVKDGSPGEPGKPGKIPIQREWKQGDIHRSNDDVIDYIYHRSTNTWWRLKDGYNNITAPVNPSNAYVQLTSVEHLAVQLIIAEQANIAGFIYKDGKQVSQYPSITNPNLVLDGVNGEIIAKSAELGRFLLNMDGFSAERKITYSGYEETVSTYLSNDGSLNMFHEANGSGGVTNKYFKFIERSSGIVQPHTPVLDLKTVRKQIATGFPVSNVCLRLEASSGGGNVGNIALDIPAGEIRVKGSAGVSGQWVFGSYRVTIVSGIITNVRIA